MIASFFRKQRHSPKSCARDTSFCMKHNVRVSIGCYNRLLRESIARILTKRLDYDVVLAPQPFELLFGRNLQPQPNLIVLDSLEFFLQQPPLTARPAGESILGSFILVAMDNDSDGFLAAVRHGAKGYILQDASATEVEAAIRTVADGGAICPPSSMRLLFDYLAG